MALVLSVSLSVATYELARFYLLDKRQTLALRQVTFNAVVVKGQLAAGQGTPADVLSSLQSNDARAVVHLGETWSAAVVQFGESAVPTSLRSIVETSGAGRQRTVIEGDPYLVYGFRIPSLDAEYYEFVSAQEYERTLTVLATVLLLAATTTTLLGAAAGWTMSRRLLRPLRAVAASAQSISDGQLSHRLDARGDPDLQTVARSFNEMAASLEARIEREQRFTADVSHELRTPLTALGAAVSLANRTELPERARFAMDVLTEQLQHFTRLTVELLDIARMDAGTSTLDVSDVDVIELIERVLDHAGVERTVLVPGAEMRRSHRIDGVRLERVVANLVENAQRYAGDVTSVTVREAGDDLVIEVDDAGPGVPDSERTSIFGRFNRGSTRQPDDMPKGTGLGLALAFEHVLLHGGTIVVSDSPDGGARFTVRLPVAGGDAS